VQYELIDSLNHPLAVEISELLSNTNFSSDIIIDDVENIAQAIASGVRLKMLISTDPDSLGAEFMQVLQDSLPVVALSKRTGKKLFGSNKFSRDFAIAARPQPLALSACNDSKRDLVVLEDLKISGNIGAIIRTSLALNAGAIVLVSDGEFDIYDRRIVRASRGLVFGFPVIVTSSAELISFCGQNEIQLVVTSSHADKNIEDIAAAEQRFGFVFGSEKSGASEGWNAASPQNVKIPLNPAVESLNVSVAVSIVLYLRSMHQDS
jgi:23S rRNA (adenosine1067-2'-O)-methyltransferase